MGHEERALPEMPPQNEPGYRRKRVEMQAKRSAAIARPPPLDDASQGGACVEPQRQLRGLKAHDELSAERYMLVR